MLQLLNSESEREYVSTLVDPFQKESIESITMWIRKGFLDRSVTFSADVKFKRGSTEGRHEIKADDFASLVKQVDDFIKHL